MLFNKVIEYCKENNLSVSAFEKQCNLSNGTVSKWKDVEADKVQLKTLKRIATGTGTPLERWIE